MFIIMTVLSTTGKKQKHEQEKRDKHMKLNTQEESHGLRLVTKHAKQKNTTWKVDGATPMY